MVVLSFVTAFIAFVTGALLAWSGLTAEPVVLILSLPVVGMALLVLVWSLRVAALILAAVAVSIHLARCVEYARTDDWSWLDWESDFLTSMASQPNWVWIVGALVGLVGYALFAAAVLGRLAWAEAVVTATAILGVSMYTFWVVLHAVASDTGLGIDLLVPMLESTIDFLAPTGYLFCAAIAGRAGRAAVASRDRPTGTFVPG